MGDDIDLLSAFINSLLTDAVSEVFVDVSDMNARLEVYRRNFMLGHCNALQKTYAMTAVYLGADFESLAVSYVCQHRPKAGQLYGTYGELFPDFLKDPIARELARLEWGLRSVVKSDETECEVVLNPERAYWQLRSDVQLFESEYNVGDLYRGLKTVGKIGRVDRGWYYYVVWVKDRVPVVQSLSLEEYRVLKLLRSPLLIDELFDKLTFSKEIIVNILPKVFNKSFLKVTHDNSIDHSEMC